MRTSQPIAASQRPVRDGNLTETRRFRLGQSAPVWRPRSASGLSAPPNERHDPQFTVTCKPMTDNPESIFAARHLGVVGALLRCLRAMARRIHAYGEGVKSVARRPGFRNAERLLRPRQRSPQHAHRAALLVQGPLRPIRSFDGAPRRVIGSDACKGAKQPRRCSHSGG
jgi:hypothetical protein